jgi:Ca2+-binding RTX toxin-like protein
MTSTTAKRLVATVLAGLFATLLLAGSASAGQLVDEGGTWVYRAGPGESNVVTVQPDQSLAPDPNVLTITDQDRTIDLPAGCTHGDLSPRPSDAYCPVKPVRVELGDGDDRGTATDSLPDGLLVTFDGGSGNDKLSGSHTGATLVSRGGDGNDELTGSYRDDVLDGGPGNDTLNGTKGNDQVLGGDGDDQLQGDDLNVGNDVIDGGNGVDTISGDWIQQDRSEGLAISLDGVANDGHPNERDNVVGVEKLELTQAATVLAGAAGLNVRIWNTPGGSSKVVGSDQGDQLRTDDLGDEIDGRGGNDSIEAGYGDDRIVGGPGQDTINADAGSGACNFLVCRGPYGNDRVEARDGEKDSVTCGVGTDTVVADPVDEIAGDCENVDRGTTGTPPGRDPRRGGEGRRPSAKRCVVPKVKAGSKLPAVKKTLAKRGCKAKTKKVASKKVRKGRVVKLSQKAGKKLKHKATVTVIVSRGRR